MKRLVFLIIGIISPLLCFSQNYNTIVTGDTSYYTFSNDNFSYFPWQNIPIETSIFIDSTGTVPGGLSFYNYRRFDYFNDPSVWCDSSTRIGWLGSHSIQYPNGMDVFVTQNGDSIFIDTQAEPAATWEFFRYPNGDYIQATLSAVSSTTIVGMTDSVKTIILQTKNGGGLNIPGDYNGKEMQLSKSRGLVKTFGYRYFPSDTTAYELSGWSGNSSGFQNLTVEEIFNFDIGDEFHYHNYTSTSAPLHNIAFIEWHVLSKTISTNNDTITYEMDNTAYYINSSFSTVTTAFYHDTISFTVIIPQWQHLSSLSEQMYNTAISSSPFPNYGFVIPFHDPTYFSRPRKYCEDFYEYDAGNNCYVWPVGSGIFPTRKFVSGLGEVYETDGTFNMRYDSLVYYKKGNEEWGNRLNWLVILGVNELYDNTTLVQITPNPASDYFQVDFDSEVLSESEFELYTLMGSLVMKTPASSKTIRIDTKLLANGIYFYRIKGRTAGFLSGKIVVAKQ